MQHSTSNVSFELFGSTPAESTWVIAFVFRVGLLGKDKVGVKNFFIEGITSSDVSVGWSSFLWGVIDADLFGNDSKNAFMFLSIFCIDLNTLSTAHYK